MLNFLTLVTLIRLVRNKKYWWLFLIQMMVLSFIEGVLFGGSFPEKPASDELPGHHRPPAYQIIHYLEAEYVDKVEKIFKKHCFDCHILNQSRSWWQKLPILRQLVSRTRKKSMEAFDLSGGFPFLGSRGLEEDLLRINQQIAKGKMPPPWLRFVSGSYSLGRSEKEAVLFWTHLGIQMLRDQSDQTAERHN